MPNKPLSPAPPAPLIRIVRMTFREEKVAEFLEVFTRSKHQIRRMPGCRHLELWQDLHEPHIFTTYSHWDTEEHLNAYRTSELFGQVWPATKQLFAAKPVAFTVFSAVQVGSEAT